MERKGGAGGAWEELPRCSIPGTNKGAKPGEMGGDWKRASSRTVAGFLWLGPPLRFFSLSVSLLNMKKNATLKKDKRTFMHVDVYLEALSEEFLLFAPHLPMLQ